MTVKWSTRLYHWGTVCGRKKSRLKLAASMIRKVMPEFCTKKNVVILCDSWYAKKNLVCVVNEYSNLDIICNARCDSVIYDLAPKPTGRRGRPAKHGRRLSIQEDFVLSDEKVGGQLTLLILENFILHTPTTIIDTITPMIPYSKIVIIYEG